MTGGVRATVGRLVPVRLRRKGAAPRPRTRACNAPFTSMYLDQRGWVRACCMNDTFTLGNVADTSLLDIWNGEKAGRLRRAMEAHDLTLGCDICRWQVEEGRPDLAYSVWFDDLEVSEPDPAWPRQLELSISNTCNLQCVMCNGEWSSSIRSQREGLEPLPKVYDDTFFEDLRAFLPHLEWVKVLGGEPFLAGETLQILEMIAEGGFRPRVHITTNGTQWSPRVERILDLLPVDIAVSLDAATAGTYESIRVGSSWAKVMDHLDRFQAKSRDRGTDVTLTFCLMTVNWHEFADFCLLADERGLGCAVNTVTMPEHLSLFKVPEDELAAVVEGLERQDAEMGGRLGLSLATWTGELEKLRNHLDDRRAGKRIAGLESIGDVTSLPIFSGAEADGGEAVADPTVRAETVAELRERHLGPSFDRIVTGPDGVVLHLDLRGPTLLGIDPRKVVGASLDTVSELFMEANGLVQYSRTVEESGSAQAMEVAVGKGKRLGVVMSPAPDDRFPEGSIQVDVGWISREAS